VRGLAARWLAQAFVLGSACGRTPATDAGRAPGEPGEPSSVAIETEAVEAEALRARLQAYEDRRRDEIELGSLRPWSAQAGDDPFAIVALGDGYALGVLRGADALVLLAPGGEERARIDVAVGPTAVAVGPSGDIAVVGERSSELVHARREGDSLRIVGRHRVPGTAALRDVVLGADMVWLADRDRGELFAMPWRAGVGPGDERIELAHCGGAAALERSDRLLLAVCVLDRSLWLGELDRRGRVIEHRLALVNDGPWWSAAALADGDGWLVAGGGVEDHPLDRSDGGFGWVDSFVFVHRITRCDAGLCSERLAAIDVGEYGVVTPKWLSLTRRGEGLALVVTGYGAPAMVELELDRNAALVAAHPRAVLPGLRDLIADGDGWLAADPLLDRWVAIDARGARAVGPVPSAKRELPVRVGEALFFTSLLAPHATSDGHHSRFSCETCHFEGTVDGRVHYTGRDDVHAATKPLLGLFVNRPHFSRALDRTIAVMVDNEFAVANRGSEVGPRFSIDPAQTPWLRELGLDAPMDPEALRRAFIEFLVAFDHEPNPRARGRSSFSEREREGARAFERHCEGCHQARLQTDEIATRVPPSQWEQQVFSPHAAIVWASEQRVRTGIEPLVHPEGARVTSLRRLALKRPYFTNGSAPDLDAVLAMVELAPAFAHGGARVDADDREAAAHTRLTAEQRAALRAFLELL
jgi:hypothetical protein